MNIKKQVDATLELPADKALNASYKAVVKWTEGDPKLTIHQGMIGCSWTRTNWHCY